MSHTSAAMAAPFNALQPLQKFQKANRHVFPSVPSLRWFYRSHRAELIEAGAVVELAGRLMIDAPKFAQTALAIGARTATARTLR